MDHLLGALSPELEELREAEEGSDSDDGQVSGTDQGSASQDCWQLNLFKRLWHGRAHQQPTVMAAIDSVEIVNSV